ncbi:hypothetical protein Emag_006759 [Eimeria magna]
MDSQPPLLTSSDALQIEAAEALRGAFPDKTDCETSADELTPVTMGGYYKAGRYFDPIRGQASGIKAVQDELDHGLSELKAEPTTGEVFNPEKKPFTNTAVQNLAYLMFPGSTAVGCARTTDCEGAVIYIFCRFSPTLVNGKSVPFPAGIFESMLARERYKGGGGGGAAGGESAASFALPGVGLLVFTVMATRALQ